MSITDNVINIALLGTANREMTSGELPEDLVGILERLKENAADGEEVFYKGAAAFFAYYRSGLEPLKLKDLFRFRRRGRKRDLMSGRKRLRY